MIKFSTAFKMTALFIVVFGAISLFALSFAVSYSFQDWYDFAMACLFSSVIVSGLSAMPLLTD